MTRGVTWLLTILLGLSSSAALATPTATTSAPGCGHFASTGFGAVSSCNTQEGSLSFSEFASGISCLRTPSSHASIMGSNVAYTGSSITSDGSGTFNFFGGPKVSTIYGAASFGEQRVIGGFGPLVRWGNFNFVTNRFTPSSAWMVDAGAFNCPTPSRRYDYPDFLAPGAEHGTDQTFSLGVKNVNMGVVRINEYIAKDHVCDIGLCFDGDNRGPDPYSYANESRIAIELNFITGTGHIYARESCQSGEVGCLAPRPLRRVTDVYEAIFDQHYNNYALTVGFPQSGDIIVTLVLDATNSFVVPNSGVGCSIDRTFYLYWNATSYQFELHGWSGDPFPSQEIYWYQGLAKNGSTFDILNRTAESGGPAALCQTGG